MVAMTTIWIASTVGPEVVLPEAVEKPGRVAKVEKEAHDESEDCRVTDEAATLTREVLEKAAKAAVVRVEVAAEWDVRGKPVSYPPIWMPLLLLREECRLCI